MTRRFKKAYRGAQKGETRDYSPATWSTYFPKWRQVTEPVEEPGHRRAEHGS